MAEIAKNNLAVYGFEEVKKAAETGAIKVLLITDSFIQRKRQENSFAELDYVMRAVEKQGGEVLIVSFEHEGGKKLEGLGSIAALLRYKIY